MANTRSAIRALLDTAYLAALALTDDSGTTKGQKSQFRSNVYAAPFDALAYSGMQINGSMEVSQENTTSAVTLATTVRKYGVDGFAGIYAHAANTAVLTLQQIAPP